MGDDDLSGANGVWLDCGFSALEGAALALRAKVTRPKAATSG